MDPSECNASSVRRTIWDGNQELAEIHAPGGLTQTAGWDSDLAPYPLPRTTSTCESTSFDTNPFYGQVIYTGGMRLDQPLSIARIGYTDFPSGATAAETWTNYVVMPLWNSQGRPWIGVFANGAAVLQKVPSVTNPSCPISTSPQRCVQLQWPLSWTPFDQKKGYLPLSWHGTMLEGKRDKTGTQYMRSRYYDPSSGRFTQEDPIGLAGGLNLYGFAKGDPVNFSDPFGLCPPEDNDPCNMKTGDRNLDSPKSRNVMERAHKRSLKTLDSEGLPREVGGACDAGLACQEAVGTAFNVAIPEVEGTAFEYHTHSEGFYKVPGDVRVIGANPSDLDLNGAKGLGYPAYIVARNTIFRLTYDQKKDRVNVTRFQRWTP